MNDFLAVVLGMLLCWGIIFVFFHHAEMLEESRKKEEMDLMRWRSSK
jgi:hypothetical protein